MDWLTYCWNASIAYLDAHAGAITGVGTGVIAAFTIALAVSTKRLWKEAKTASGIAAKSADAAKAAAKAAEKTVASMDATAERQLRAYISVEMTAAKKLGAAESVEFSFDIKNVGSTPAYDVTAFTDMFVDKYPLPSSVQKYDLSQCVAAAGGSATVIGPNLSNASYTTSNLILDPLQFGAIAGGSSRLYIRGVIVYRDVFKVKTRHTWFGACVGGPRMEQEMAAAPVVGGKKTLMHLFEHVGQLNDAD